MSAKIFIYSKSVIFGLSPQWEEHQFRVTDTREIYKASLFTQESHCPTYAQSPGKL